MARSLTVKIMMPLYVFASPFHQPLGHTAVLKHIAHYSWGLVI